MKRIICMILSLAISAMALCFVQLSAAATESRLIVFSAENDDGCLTRDEVARQMQLAALDKNTVFSAACDSSVEVIGDSAFEDCSFLLRMTLSDSLTSIGAQAFNGSGLVGINVPDSVQSIGTDAFGRDGETITVMANHDSYAWHYAQTQDITVRASEQSILSALQEALIEETLIVGSSFALPTSMAVGPDALPMLRWVSGNPEVASVSDSGSITALSVGKAAIGVETVAGLLAVGEITVQAKPVSVTGVTILNGPKSMTKGETLTLKTRITPSNATNKEIKWSISDKSVLKVDQSGKITAVAPGKAIITAAAKDGSGKKASCTLTVQSYVTLKVGEKMAIHNGSWSTVDNTGAKPFKVKGRTMLPLRFLGEKLGGRVKYTKDTAPIIMTFGNKTVSFSLGKTLMRVSDGTTTRNVWLETPAQKREGRTYIPLRAIGQALGFTVYYESEDELIIVSSSSMSQSVRTARLSEYRKAEQAAFDKFVDLAIQYAEKQPQYPVNRGKTIYGALFGNAYGAWCTEFVLWCFYQAEKDLGTSYIRTVYPWRNNSVSCVSWFRSQGRLRYRSSGYVPKRGDMIFYNYGTGGSTDHTGLVTGTYQKNGVTYVQTIEGNIPSDSPKQIRKLNLPLNSSKIVCYGSCRG